MRAPTLALLATTLASAAAAQGGGGTIRGVAYDSLAAAPLGGAIVWLRGVDRHAVTDSAGRFRLDSVPVGPHVVALMHPELEPLGLSTLTAAATVAMGDTAAVTLAVPSLTTFWRRGCRDTLGSRLDGGIVVGTVDDAANGARLAGAAVLASWLRLIQHGNGDVLVQEREARAQTDSLGAYYLCGVTTEVVVRLRAYGGADSTGAVDVRIGPSGVARRDLTISLAAADDTPASRAAALRGVARTSEGQPLPRARVIVHEAGSGLTDDNGTFLLAGLPAGTQWVSIQAIGRERFEQAVVLRAGDTTALDATLGPLAITLEPVRVMGTRGARLMTEFDRRRRAGWGHVRTADEIQRMGTVRGVFGTIPSVRFPRARSAFDLTVLLPRGAGGLCVAPLFIDGERADYEQLRTYQLTDLTGVEVYPRASTVPQEYQLGGSNCGVVLIWTKYLR